MASTSGRNGASEYSTLPGSPCSMVCGGATRSIPSITGAGSGLPLDSTVTCGPVSSVVVRLSFDARYSATAPSTLTRSPT